jgi:hypothetical protein
MYLEAENTGDTLDEHLENSKESVIEEVPYEKESKCVKPISFILPAIAPEPARKNINTEKSNWINF